MRTSADAATGATAAFFDLDKTLISRSSTLAFAPSFYRHGLISGAQAVRGALAQLAFRLGGADHGQMEKIKAEVSKLCCGWQVERVAEIVSTHLADTIGPIIYADARRLVDAHKRAGRDVIIVSTSGLEMVGPIGAMLGASAVIATKMRHADGLYTGELEFYAYGEAKAIRIRELSAERGYRLADCFAYSDSVTDLPMLEAVGRPHVVNPDRHLRRIAAQRGWPVLAFAHQVATCEQQER
ncbi:MAG TPA: HAD family hydrolase [Streptosporangiaceae bacterium]|nr:HAD family hydrolase [Streptosporangiaceae bacterium]